MQQCASTQVVRTGLQTNVSYMVLVLVSVFHAVFHAVDLMLRRCHWSRVRQEGLAAGGVCHLVSTTAIGLLSWGFGRGGGVHGWSGVAGGLQRLCCVLLSVCTRQDNLYGFEDVL